jgi:hypothetical protein
MDNLNRPDSESYLQSTFKRAQEPNCWYQNPDLSDHRNLFCNFLTESFRLESRNLSNNHNLDATQESPRAQVPKRPERF